MIYAQALLVIPGDTDPEPCASCANFFNLRPIIHIAHSETRYRPFTLCVICAFNITAMINAQLNLLEREHKTREL